MRICVPLHPMSFPGPEYHRAVTASRHARSLAGGRRILKQRQYPHTSSSLQIHFEFGGAATPARSHSMRPKTPCDCCFFKSTGFEARHSPRPIIIWANSIIGRIFNFQDAEKSSHLLLGIFRDFYYLICCKFSVNVSQR